MRGGERGRERMCEREGRVARKKKKKERETGREKERR